MMNSKLTVFLSFLVAALNFAYIPEAVVASQFRFGAWGLGLSSVSGLSPDDSKVGYGWPNNLAEIRCLVKTA